MKTERLYYEDVYLKEFEGKVLSCEEQEGTFRIVLDRTAFYPEGGGQPADRGTLQGVKVIDVQEEGECVIHITENSLTPGDIVTGRIDWEHRFLLMQQHSGEHIVSGMIHGTYGYDNVGFHMGSDVITIDFNGIVPEEDLPALEQRANDYIWENHPVKIFHVEGEEKATLPYRSKIEIPGDVRLVEYPGADLCACCGTHVSYTGEIGLIKLLSSRRFRSGVRIEMLCGKDAFRFLNEHYEQNRQIAVEFSVKPHETFGAVQRMKKELLGWKNELNALKLAGFRRTAHICRDKGNVLVFEDSMSPNDIRRQADAVLDTCGGICIILSGRDGESYQYAIGEREGSVKELVQSMNAALQGRGGGKPNFAQGTLKENRKNITDFFTERGFLVL